MNERETGCAIKQKIKSDATIHRGDRVANINAAIGFVIGKGSVETVEVESHCLDEEFESHPTRFPNQSSIRGSIDLTIDVTISSWLRYARGGKKHATN